MKEIRHRRVLCLDFRERHLRGIAPSCPGQIANPASAALPAAEFGCNV